MQGLPSSQLVGQLPALSGGMPTSHASPDSTTPLPQTLGQSMSTALVAPAGQQPSPFLSDCVDDRLAHADGRTGPRRDQHGGLARSGRRGAVVGGRAGAGAPRRDAGVAGLAGLDDAVAASRRAVACRRCVLLPGRATPVAAAARSRISCVLALGRAVAADGACPSCTRAPSSQSAGGQAPGAPARDRRVAGLAGIDAPVAATRAGRRARRRRLVATPPSTTQASAAALERARRPSGCLAGPHRDVVRRARWRRSCRPRSWPGRRWSMSPAARSGQLRRSAWSGT